MKRKDYLGKVLAGGLGFAGLSALNVGSVRADGGQRESYLFINIEHPVDDSYESVMPMRSKDIMRK